MERQRIPFILEYSVRPIGFYFVSADTDIGKCQLTDTVHRADRVVIWPINFYRADKKLSADSSINGSRDRYLICRLFGPDIWQIEQSVGHYFRWFKEHNVCKRAMAL